MVKKKPLLQPPTLHVPKIKVDDINGVNGVIVVGDTPGVVFATINRQFAHLAPEIVARVNAGMPLHDMFDGQHINPHRKIEL